MIFCLLVCCSAWSAYHGYQPETNKEINPRLTGEGVVATPYGFSQSL